MLVVPRRLYMKRYAIGGSGIFDSLSNFMKRLATSNAARTAATAVAKASKTEIGKTALTASKAVAKELATTVINTAKDVAVAKGKQAVSNRGPKAITPQTVEILTQLDNLQPITKQLKDQPAPMPIANINNLMAGSAIRIQDLVRTLNSGSGF